jgi:hypothetical protein
VTIAELEAYITAPLERQCLCFHFNAATAPGACCCSQLLVLFGSGLEVKWLVLVVTCWCPVHVARWSWGRIDAAAAT